MRRAVCFDLGHHLLLQRQIFKHRLDHDIHLFKAGVIGRAGDQHHLFLPLGRAHALAAHPLAEHVPAVFQRVIDAGFIDVFDTNRQTAAGGGDAGDAAAHQTAAENADAVQGARLSIAAPLFFSAVEAKNRLRSAADCGVIASSPKARASAS